MRSRWVDTVFVTQGSRVVATRAQGVTDCPRGPAGALRAPGRTTTFRVLLLAHWDLGPGAQGRKGLWPSPPDNLLLEGWSAWLEHMGQQLRAPGRPGHNLQASVPWVPHKMVSPAGL